MYKIKLDGTTKDIFEIGLGKGVLDFSALTTSRLLKFPDSNGSTGYVLTTDGSGNLSWSASGGGTPGGSDTQIQFNDGGAFGGDSDFTWDKTNNILSMSGFSFVPGIVTNALMFRNDTASANSIFGIQHASSTATSTPNVGFNRSRGTYASPTVVSSGDRLGSISFRGHDGTTFHTGAAILSDTTGAWSATARGSNIALAVAKATTTTLVNVLKLEHDNTNPIYTLGQNAVFKQSTTGTYSFNNSGATTYASISASTASRLATGSGATSDLVRTSDLQGTSTVDLTIYAGLTKNVSILGGVGAVGVSDGGNTAFGGAPSSGGGYGSYVIAYGGGLGGGGGGFTAQAGNAQLGVATAGGSCSFTSGNGDTGTPGSIGGEIHFEAGDGDQGGDVHFIAGDGVTTRAGNLTFTSGNSASSTAGYITFTTGTNMATSAPGYFEIMIGPSSALKITGAGEWQLNTDGGSSGEVLTSQGAGAAPIWAPVSPSAPNYEEFVATAAQTVFNTTMTTTAKAAGKSYLQIYVNGVFQQEGATKAYTVTGATQVTFNAGVALNDDVVMYGYA